MDPRDPAPRALDAQRRLVALRLGRPPQPAARPAGAAWPPPSLEPHGPARKEAPGEGLAGRARPLVEAFERRGRARRPPTDLMIVSDLHRGGVHRRRALHALLQGLRDGRP